MAIICAICGKKQSGWIEDYPFSKNDSNIRICADCYTHLKALQETFDDEVFSKEITYFESLLSDSNTTDTAKEHINTILQTPTPNRKSEEQRSREVDEQRARKEAARRHAEEIKRIEQQRNNHLLTTGYNFEGYCIKRYIMVVSGETVLGTGMFSEFSASLSDLFGTESNAFSEKLAAARTSAENKLISRSIACGGNALIGVDFDYVNFRDNIMGVIATGTSVFIEPVSD